MKKLIFLNTIFLILCFIMFLLGTFPKEEIKQVQEINIQEINTQEEYSQILEEESFENRKLMESFVKRFHNLSKQEIKILLDTLENNAKEPIIMLSIYSVESKFDKEANSYLGAKYGRGIGQVSEIALADYNRVNKTEYTPDDLYDIATNVIVSCWVYDYNENYGIYGTEKKIIAYNEGHVYAKKKETSNYLDKVNKKMLYFNKWKRRKNEPKKYTRSSWINCC